jgi:hypothetical protein
VDVIDTLAARSIAVERTRKVRLSALTFEFMMTISLV